MKELNEMFNDTTNISAVREMLKDDCLWYKGRDISEIVKRQPGGYFYRYDGVCYDLRKCKDACDLYEALFNVRPIVIKCTDGNVLYANHYRSYVRQQTIELCEQILQEV